MSQIFNKVEKHLLKQNAKSETSGGACRYRSDYGLCCAVGCLMTDDMYDYSLEGEDVSSDQVMDAISPILGVQASKICNKLDLLGDLQKIHDNFDAVDWEELLARVKRDYHIS
tara:strand:- start:7167 stop:7505 length:339 start_codon:yes stop_codon:yes gene_type:complete